MPTAVIDNIEIKQGGREGSPPPPPAGGDDSSRGPGGDASAVTRRAYFTGLTLALGGILMFFMALTSAYIVRKGLGENWQAIALPRILWLNTAVLLASSATIEIARRKLARSAMGAFRAWWWVTTTLGVAFLVGQLVAWREMVERGIYLAGSPASSFFYVLTASHGLHLVGGIVFLFYVAFRAWSRSSISQGTAAELAAVYWHFMDGLWVFLLLLVSLGQ